jgi:enamine deaminase RidA (YjgF/YER057c/UK114 family)
MVLALAPPLRPQPPSWVEDFLTGAHVLHGAAAAAEGQRLTWRRADRFTLLEGIVEDAAELPARALVDAVAALYRSIEYEVHRQDRHAVRIWNFVPDIHGQLETGDRYMTFNAGRFAAYRDALGGTDTFPMTLPTASAVGISEHALSVHVLAADERGQPVENPRQTPPYLYSARYGARPPCFARATRLGPTLFIGGTASILGEDTQHEDDVEQQTREACANISALLDAAMAASSVSANLGALQSVRVHVRDADHAPDVLALLDQLAPELPVVELVQAPLCRRELLVK